MCRQEEQGQPPSCADDDGSAMPTSSSSSSSAAPWPEGNATNVWQRWTYQYMAPILAQSLQRNTTTSNHAETTDNDASPAALNYADIYTVPDRLASQHLRQAFWKEYSHQLAMQQQRARNGRHAKINHERVQALLVLPNVVDPSCLNGQHVLLDLV